MEHLLLILVKSKSMSVSMANKESDGEENGHPRASQAQKSIALYGSFGAFYATLLGYFYQDYLLRRFDLLVSNFFGIEDYLLAVIQGHPAILLFVFLNILSVVVSLIFFPGIFGKQPIKEKLGDAKKIIILETRVLLLIGPFLAALAGHFAAGEIITGSSAASRFSSCVSITVDGSTKKWTLFSSSADYLFLYGKSGGVQVVRRDEVPSIRGCSESE